MSASVDTNIVLRLIVADVPDQARIAERLFSDVVNPVVVNDQALIETAFALVRHYGISRDECARAIGSVLSLPTVLGDHQVFRAALAEWVAHSKLSLTDCYLAQAASAAGAVPLWTFDRKLATQHPAARLATDSQ